MQFDEYAKEFYREFWDVKAIGDVEGQIVGEYPDDKDDLNALHLLDYLGADKVVSTEDNVILLAERFRRPTTNGNDFALRADTGTEEAAESDKFLEAVQGYGAYPGVFAFGKVNESEDGFQYFHLIDFNWFLVLLSRDKLETHRVPNPDGTAALYCDIEHMREKNCILRSWGSGWE